MPSRHACEGGISTYATDKSAPREDYTSFFAGRQEENSPAMLGVSVYRLKDAAWELRLRSVFFLSKTERIDEMMNKTDNQHLAALQDPPLLKNLFGSLLSEEITSIIIPGNQPDEKNALHLALKTAGDPLLVKYEAEIILAPRQAGLKNIQVLITESMARFSEYCGNRIIVLLTTNSYGTNGALTFWNSGVYRVFLLAPEGIFLTDGLGFPLSKDLVKAMRGICARLSQGCVASDYYSWQEVIL